MLPMTEDRLRDLWTYRSTVKLAILMPWATEELEKTGKELLRMESARVKGPVKDFRLLCIVTITEDEEPFVLSFSKDPLSVCVNGEALKPSWKVMRGVSQFLPGGLGSDLLSCLRDE